MNETTYVITGAAGGIGRCVAKQLHQDGARVLLIDIQEQALHAFKEELQKQELMDTDRISILCADLSDKASIPKLQEALGKYDCIDGLIHCAGLMGEYGRCHEINPDLFDLVMKHQCYSAFHAAHAVLPKFCENKGGNIVIVSGVGGVVALPHLPAYTAALHGVNGLIRSLALDYGKNSIRVNGVLPAATQTPMYKKAQTTHTAQSRTGALMKPAVPLMKVASPKEVADVIMFLLSKKASHVNGALIPVDGGFTAY